MYKLISVERTTAPDGIDGIDWCQYIIARNAANIMGYRRGTVEQVTQYATHYVEALNTRATSLGNPYRFLISSTQQN